MSDHPIIFDAESIAGILNGSKTQTRRIVRGKGLQDALTFLACEGDDTPAGDLVVQYIPDHPRGASWYAYCGEYPEEGTERLGAPYGIAGQKLWVREAWFHDADEYDPAISNTVPIYRGGGVAYRADAVDGARPTSGWRSPIFMPRWASRITLEVLDVSVERLQAITEDDARAEGIEPIPSLLGWTVVGERGDAWWQGVKPAVGDETYRGRIVAVVACEFGGESALEAYAGRWDVLNAKRGYSWESNPWVWVVSFSYPLTPLYSGAILLT